MTADSYLKFERLVKADCRIIEPKQFEAAFYHRLFIKDENGKAIYPKAYEVQSYFFFPAQMKVNPKSYPIESFYRENKSFINFRIPKLSFKEIMGFTDNPLRSPLRKILEELTCQEAKLSEQKSSFIRQEARVFGCAFYNFLMRKLKKTSISPLGFYDYRINPATFMNDFMSNLSKIHMIFKEWHRIIETVTEKGFHELLIELNIVDEYVSYLIVDHLLHCMESIEEAQISRADRHQLAYSLRTRLRALRIYIRSRRYLWIDDRSTEVQREAYLYRRHLLKKKVWSSLYLDPLSKPLFRLQKQLGAMIAAALAGVWAVLAEISLRNSNQGGAIGLSSSTLIIITAFTLAYVLKDRIKELGRGYFKRGLFGRLPDVNSKIIYPKENSGQKTIKVGNYQESVKYLKVQNAPSDILDLVSRHSDLDEEEIKTVLLYNQQISLNHRPIRQLKRKIRAVYSFLRFNLSSLTTGLDNYFEDGLLPTDGLSFSKANLPKTYRIDLVVKVSGRAKKPSKAGYRFFRLIVCKEGILRIENLSTAYDGSSWSLPSHWPSDERV